MGTVYTRAVFGTPEPRVGLMSMGEEASKGTDVTKEVHEALKGSSLNFVGNVEGHDIFTGQGRRRGHGRLHRQCGAQGERDAWPRRSSRTCESSSAGRRSAASAPGLRAVPSRASRAPRRRRRARRRAAPGRQGLLLHRARALDCARGAPRDQGRRRVLCERCERESDSGAARRWRCAARPCEAGTA